MSDADDTQADAPCVMLMPLLLRATVGRVPLAPTRHPRLHCSPA